MDSQTSSSSRRGSQFSHTALPELIDTLAKTKARMHLVEGLLRADTIDQPLDEGEAPLTREQLTSLRREMVSLQSDLRAELRRRTEM